MSWTTEVMKESGTDDETAQAIRDAAFATAVDVLAIPGVRDAVLLAAYKAEFWPTDVDDMDDLIMQFVMEVVWEERDTSRET